jgi:orotate phosphoribosyltransferase
MNRTETVRERALEEMKDHGVVMLDGHFDYGNGFHGSAYLNPHQLLVHPSTIWRLAQDLLDLIPYDLIERADIIAGPATGGALLAHTLAGLLDGRRSLTRRPYRFAPFTVGPTGLVGVRSFYASHLKDSHILLADDVRNTGQTFRQCARIVEESGGKVIGTVELVDRLETETQLGVPNVALAEYRAPVNYPAPECPLCKAGKPITSF